MREKANKKIREEFRNYKKKVLRYPLKESIWNESNRISFYQCISEFFEYKKDISEASLRFVLCVEAPIATLWNFFLQEEDSGFYTFEEVEDLMERLLMKDKMEGEYYGN